MGALGVAPAQAPPPGAWVESFSHKSIDWPPGNQEATDHLIPFGGHLNANISYYIDAVSNVYRWPHAKDSLTGGRAFDPNRPWFMFNAGHAALIPKGPHQGKVLVWVESPFLIKPDPTFSPVVLGQHDYWGCQAYSIVDPSASALPRIFRNFVLPIAVVNIQPGAGASSLTDLFCAGQAWSPYGDLIVVGGQMYIPPLLGSKLTYAWNPDEPVGQWPVPSPPPTSLYPGEFGFWQPGPMLQWDRWYPTATLTARLTRLATAAAPLGLEVMLVLGGSAAFNFQYWTNPQWNSYEALQILGRATPTSVALATDVAFGMQTWTGPGTTGPPGPSPWMDWQQDWFENYPRCHLLSSGHVFFSGYAPRWSAVDHDLAPGSWISDQQPVPPPPPPPVWSSNWNHMRYDGTSLLFPNIFGLVDVVARIGGAAEIPAPIVFGTTESAEAWLPSTGEWAPLSPMPPNPSPSPNGRSQM
ncbi:MAG TPA: hypothetical protein VFC01_12245, partial [Mycobacterium sp.]|nr:hypothetical protein [Mycobacterium sp.]